MAETYSRYTGTIKLVVFDWAGTTVDFGCLAPTLAFVEGFRMKGVNIPMDIARGPMGMEKREHIKKVTEVEDVASAWRQVHGRSVTEADIDEMFNDFSPILLQTLSQHSSLIPGVIKAVEFLRGEGIKIGSTTGYFKEAAEIIIEQAARSGYSPDCNVNASEVQLGRPYPWMIYRVMEALAIYPPAAVAAVGDTPIDVEAGRNGGVWTIGVAGTGNEMGLSYEEFKALPGNELDKRLNRSRRKLLDAGAHFVIDTMNELPEIIKQINYELASGQQP